MKPFIYPRSYYRILGLIGQGQFGKVYCGIHRQTGKLYALKNLELQRFPTNRFLQELFYLVTLHHPNIVACQAIEHHPTGRYLIMDYCEGGTLRELIESESRVNLMHRLKLIADILSALEYAHQRNIIHCDIKPENILLKLTATGWKASLTDFGIARLSETRMTAPEGGYTGSPAYMAPERFYGKYSSASDIYAVGIILYELVVGKRPFSGLPGELTIAHLNQRVTVPVTVPAILQTTIETALQKLPQRRFASAGEMLKSVLLAAQVLASQTTSQSLFIASETPKRDRLPLLPDSITHLVIDSHQVYLGKGDRLCCLTYADDSLKGQQWEVTFPAPLVELHVSSHVCFASSQLNGRWEIYAFPRTSQLKQFTAAPYRILSLKAQTCLSAIAPQGEWLALAIQSDESEPGKLQVLRYPSLNLRQTSFNTPFPSHLIVLDRRYGLVGFADYTQGKTETRFQVFNRRGHFFAGFSLPFTLSSVTTNAAFPYQLLALEASNLTVGVLIKLKPFKITRIALDFVPKFILARLWGYELLDRSGNFMSLDAEGKRILPREGAISWEAIAQSAENRQ